MRISVAMATYNGGTFLEQQLASLAGQTFLPCELVVSDDGSSDQTLSIVEAFAKRAPFPIVVLANAARLGFEDNFLRAAEACSGDFIATCDQDDVWLPNKLELCAQRLTDDRSAIVLHPLTVTDDRLIPIGDWMQGIMADKVYEPLELDPHCIGWGNSMIFAREIVHLLPKDVRPRQPERNERILSHDTWIYTLAAALYRVSHTTTPLILYRQHSANALGVTDKRRSTIERWASVSIYSWLEKAKIDIQLAELFGRIAKDHPHLSQRATLARQRFEERAQGLIARIGMFKDPSIRERASSFRAFYAHSDGTPNVRSRMKSLLFGVSGLYHLLSGSESAGRNCSRGWRERVAAGASI